MKRLLLPLLAALTLPTAVNANWLSGDIVETNAVGEKYIVKKTTIDAFEVFRVKDLNTFSTSLDPTIKWMEEKEKMWKEKFANCLASSKWGRSFCYEVQEYPRKISAMQGNISEYKKRKADREEHVKYLKGRLPREYKRFNPKRIIYIKLAYTPIFENLNQIKSVQNEAEVQCWNPRINYRHGTTKLSSLESKICNKYAKF